MPKRISIKNVLEMVKLCKAEGADIRIPFPKARPLTILIYRECETPNPKILRFKTLADAYVFLEDIWRGFQ